MLLNDATTYTVQDIALVIGACLAEPYYQSDNLRTAAGQSPYAMSPAEWVAACGLHGIKAGTARNRLGEARRFQREVGEIPGGVEMSAKTKTKARKGTTKPKATAKVATKPAAKPAATGPREGTKLALMIDMMRKPNGATVAEIAKAVEWAEQAVRGCIHNNVRGRHKLTVDLAEDEKRGTVYRIAKAAA